MITKEVKYFLFQGGSAVITQSPHGEYQQYNDKGVAMDFRSRTFTFVAPWDGCEIINRGDIGSTGEWFDLRIAKRAFIRCVHGKPTKDIGGSFKAGEKVGDAIPSQGSYTEHWHFAVRLEDQNRWRDPMTYMDHRTRLGLGSGFSSDKWLDWNTYEDRTITIDSNLKVYDPYYTEPEIEVVETYDPSKRYYAIEDIFLYDIKTGETVDEFKKGSSFDISKLVKCKTESEGQSYYVTVGLAEKNIDNGFRSYELTTEDPNNPVEPPEKVIEVDCEIRIKEKEEEIESLKQELQYRINQHNESWEHIVKLENQITKYKKASEDPNASRFIVGNLRTLVNSGTMNGIYTFIVVTLIPSILVNQGAIEEMLPAEIQGGFVVFMAVITYLYKNNKKNDSKDS